MQRDADSIRTEPRLASLAALVAGVLGVTGVCVASFLAEDWTRPVRGVPSVGGPAQCAETLSRPAPAGWTALEAASEAPCGRPS